MILKRLASFAVFGAMIVAFVVYVGSLGIRIGVPAHRTSLSMDVSDINNLVVGSNVLLRGVTAGKITAIDSSLSNATIHFYIDGNYTVPVDSAIRLENLSALGESYVELEPRSAGGPVFQDGQRISTDAVTQPPSISQLGASVVRVMNQLDPGQLSHVIDEADAGLPDPYVVLPNLQRASLLLHNTTADLNGRGREALENVQSLLEHAGFVGPALATGTAGLQDLGPHLQKLWNNGANITLRTSAPGSVYVFGKLLYRIQKLLDDRAPDIRVLTEPLAANMNAIAAALSTIDTGQVLANLLAAVPEDGVINLHVTNSEGQGGN
jgi:phospholipid/cholesterol/gamma-HCH transport system substrate-binding protein